MKDERLLRALTRCYASIYVHPVNLPPLPGHPVSLLCALRVAKVFFRKLPCAKMEKDINKMPQKVDCRSRCDIEAYTVSWCQKTKTDFRLEDLQVSRLFPPEFLTSCARTYGWDYLHMGGTKVLLTVEPSTCLGGLKYDYNLSIF